MPWFIFVKSVAWLVVLHIFGLQYAFWNTLCMIIIVICMLHQPNIALEVYIQSTHVCNHICLYPPSVIQIKNALTF